MFLPCSTHTPGGAAEQSGTERDLKSGRHCLWVSRVCWEPAIGCCELTVSVWWKASGGLLLGSVRVLHVHHVRQQVTVRLWAHHSEPVDSEKTTVGLEMLHYCCKMLIRLISENVNSDAISRRKVKQKWKCLFIPLIFQAALWSLTVT